MAKENEIRGEGGSKAPAPECVYSRTLLSVE